MVLANKETLFTSPVLWIEMAVNEALDQMEHKGCAILYSASNENKEGGSARTVRIKAGAEGARFCLYSLLSLCGSRLLGVVL